MRRHRKQLPPPLPPPLPLPLPLPTAAGGAIATSDCPGLPGPAWACRCCEPFFATDTGSGARRIPLLQSFDDCVGVSSYDRVEEVTPFATGFLQTIFVARFNLRNRPSVCCCFLLPRSRRFAVQSASMDASNSVQIASPTTRSRQVHQANEHVLVPGGMKHPRATSFHTPRASAIMSRRGLRTKNLLGIHSTTPLDIPSHQLRLYTSFTFFVRLWQ